MKNYLAISPNIPITNCIIFNAGNFKHAKEILKMRILPDTILQEVKIIELETAKEKKFFIEHKKNNDDL